MGRIIVEEGLTFDDVLLIPRYSKILPWEVDISTRLTRKIELLIPIVTAAMDTVTEQEMAIAIAHQGGMGFIHKNLGIGTQASKVGKVKRAESGIIMKPFTLPATALIKDAFRLMKDKGISGIPILDKNEHLVGIVTRRDLRFRDPSDEKSVEEIMTREVITVRKSTSINAVKQKMLENGIEKIPIVSSEGELLGMYTFRDISSGSVSLSCKDGKGRLRVGAAVGVTPDVMERVTELERAGVDVICVDTAHGHSKGVLETVKKTKSRFPDLPLIAGNVATKEGAWALIKAGTDAVKVGMGPGSICTTQPTTGAGVPQLTAIMWVAKACKEARVPLIADGGIRFGGDVVKALAAGADVVMSGSLFAGTEESPSETVIYEGRKFKLYRGMGSREAMEAGSKDRYSQEIINERRKLVPEGVAGRVPYSGTVAEVVNQLVGGIRSGMGYCGAKDIRSLRKARFIKISHASRIESHPHDVEVTSETPF